MKSKKFLVTGGTGFIGRNLVRRLLAGGYEVRVLDNDFRGKIGTLKDIEKDLEFVQGDIRDPEIVQKACQGIDAVCHLAYINGTEFFYSMPTLVLDVGVRGMINIIDACLKEGVGELMLASSSEVYQTAPIPTDERVGLSIPDPLNPRYSYAAGKIISEIMAINYGRKEFKRVLIFRPHNVYGPDMGLEHVVPQLVLRMRKLIQESPVGKILFPIQGTGEETRSFIYIEDFIEGLMLVLEKGEHLGIYHIGTEEEISIKNAALAVARYFGREIEIIPGNSVIGGTKRRCPNVAKIRALGFKPQYTFTRGLSLTARWYEQQ